MATSLKSRLARCLKYGVYHSRFHCTGISSHFKFTCLSSHNYYYYLAFDPIHRSSVQSQITAKREDEHFSIGPARVEGGRRSRRQTFDRTVVSDARVVTGESKE